MGVMPCLGEWRHLSPITHASHGVPSALKLLVSSFLTTTRLFFPKEQSDLLLTFSNCYFFLKRCLLFLAWGTVSSNCGSGSPA